ncbi:MAG: hypothetical protein BJ554DRAFT_2248, partial [Olpidium bornovanus]
LLPLPLRVLFQKTAAGVFIPEKSQESLNQGVVLAVGEGARNKVGKRLRGPFFARVAGR